MGPLWAPGRLQLEAGEQGEFVWLSKALGGTIREAQGSPRKTEAAQGSRAGGGGREDGFLCEKLSLERKVFLNAPLDDPIGAWQMDITGKLLIHGRLQL